MARLTLDEVGRATGGRVTLGAQAQASGLQTPIEGYSIDSRTLSAGDLFFAIVGPRVDGHDFVEDAVRKEASAVVVAKGGPQRWPGAKAIVRVSDTTRALQDLGAHVRRRRPLKVVGITGSAGKTTAKEMTHAVLETRLRTHRSEGNLNNAWGLPLTLLRMSDGCEASVLEMGMSYAGEIARLVAIADPDVGVILNVLPVHLEHFGSLDGIARAKGELFAGLRRDAVAVYNADDARVARLGRAFEGETIPYGLTARRVEVTASSVVSKGIAGTHFTLRRGSERAKVTLRLAGRQHVYNALAAAAAGFACGLDAKSIARGLGRVRPAAMRGEVHRTPKGVVIVDESYNSNPAAMERALELLADTRPRGRRILAMGDMLELGPSAARAHATLGRLAARSGIDLMVAVGPLSRHAADAASAAGRSTGRTRRGAKSPAVHPFDDSESAARFLLSEARRGDLVLVKGSRGMKMERVVRALLGTADGTSRAATGGA
jgi:UDP-N-acetylmuramoyl-tripeptide--D-alanyl-D-alanine ligase